MGRAGQAFSRLAAMMLAFLLVAQLAPAEAQVSHRVRFVAEPQVQVWSESGEAAIGSEVTLRLSAGAAEFGGEARPVLGGQLLAVAAPEGVITQRVQVASNTGFDVIAEARSPGWRIEARLVAIGPNAQAIGGGGGSVVLDLSGQRAAIFAQQERTAAGRGAPASQAVVLDVRAEPTGPVSGPAPLIHVVCRD